MAELPIVVSPTREAIFAAYEADAHQGFRLHLGASLIGKPCERSLWYDFRWTTVAQHPGRLLRLFETGQLEEPASCAICGAPAPPYSKSIPRPGGSGGSRRTAATSVGRSTPSR
jgi:hypothetical protein